MRPRRRRRTRRASCARGFTNGDLGEHTKHELLELAAAIDIEGRTTMSKAELVSAIEKASRPAR